MNYYKRHLGDYAKDAGHLSMAEHGAFTMLLDRYYSVERAIATTEAHKVCRARSPAEREIVDAVLSEFFQETPDGWRNKRADAEIEKYQVKAERNRESGAKGGRPKASGNPNGFQDETQTVSKNNPRHKPLATSHKEAPPVVPQGGRTRRSKAQTFAEWSADRIELVPANDPIHRWCEEAGVPADYLHLAWLWFADKYDDGTHRQADWLAHFRNAVKNNWGRLWWSSEPGRVALTTTGQQWFAIREKAAA